MFDVFIYHSLYPGKPDIHYNIQDLSEKIRAAYAPKLGLDKKQIYYYFLPYRRGKYTPFAWIINEKKQIELKKELPAFFNGLVVTDSAYYFVGPYKQFWIHEFDKNFNYLRSFIRVEDKLGDGAVWHTPCCGVDNTLYFVHPEYNILYVVKNRQLEAKICWQDTSWNFKIKIINQDTAISKYKGTNSIMVKDRFCYLSMFSHIGGEKRFWVDVIDLKRKKAVKSFNTENLYYFDNDGEKWYLTTGWLYHKKIYTIEFK